VANQYTYRRDSNGRTHGPYDGLTKRQAYQLVGQSLCDNGLASKADAQRFAATIPSDGTPTIYGPYTFVITAQDNSSKS
jgi:hypothetical protein